MDKERVISLAGFGVIGAMTITLVIVARTLVKGIEEVTKPLEASVDVHYSARPKLREKPQKLEKVEIFGLEEVVPPPMEDEKKDALVQEEKLEIKEALDETLPAYTKLEEELQKLIRPQIPDEKNGALVYRKVFELPQLKEWDYMIRRVTSFDEKKEVVDSILRHPEFDSIYEQLRKASQMECQFLTEEDYQGTTMLPHLSNLKSCARILAAKAEIEAESGEIDEALDTLLTGFGIAKSISTEPLYLSQLTRGSLDYIALNSLEKIFNKGKADISFYRSLSYEIEEETRSNSTFYSLVGEVIFQMSKVSQSVEIVNYLSEALPKINVEELAIGNEDEEDVRRALVNYFGRDANKLQEEELAYIQMMFKLIPLTEKPYREMEEMLERFDDELQKLPEKKAISARRAVSHSKVNKRREAKLRAKLGAAKLAIALETYDAKYGQYPVNLEQLVDEGIIRKLPENPVTGEKFGYERIAYSPGPGSGDEDILWENDRYYISK